MPRRIHTISKAPKALDYTQGKDCVRSVVITFSVDDVTSAVLLEPAQLQLDPEVIHFLSGKLDSISQSIGKMTFEPGARVIRLTVWDTVNGSKAAFSKCPG